MNYYQKKVFLHHAASGECYTQEECAAKVRSFQALHQDTNGWCDLGYNFLVGGNGDVFEGRNFLAQGAHTKGFNDIAYGFCFIGNTMERLPSPAALESMNRLIECAIENGFVDENYQLHGHRQNWLSKTECPGDMFFEYMKGMDNYVYGRQHI